MNRKTVCIPPMLTLTFLITFVTVPVDAELIPLQSLVTPSTTIQKDGHLVTFALHGFIEFQSLAELFPYVESQTKRWRGALDDSQRRHLAAELLRRGVESRIVSMIDERPLETLITHTAAELSDAIAHVKEPFPAGYPEAFLAVQEKWKHSMNCWSASSSIPGRVLSNWYPIQEGIRLYGAIYDSPEHFWQAVKYHPEITIDQLTHLISQLEEKDWASWLKRLDADPNLYLPNAYAVEFLRHNLTSERLKWFCDELTRHSLQPTESARIAQQRSAAPFRFTAYEEKVLWGDLADVLHLVYTFSTSGDPIRKSLADHHFDAVYLEARKMPFISQDFCSLMFEIWRVKYQQMPRFREVISAIPTEIRLEHFLNDGDSPDIPIPVYVDYLNQMRDLARTR